MQTTLNFEIDWNLIKSTHLLKENIRLNAEIEKLNFRLRAEIEKLNLRLRKYLNKRLDIYK